MQHGTSIHDRSMVQSQRAVNLLDCNANYLRARSVLVMGWTPMNIPNGEVI